MEDFLLKCKKQGIEIKVDGENLKLNIPDGIDATDIISKVKVNKEELIAFIRKRMQLNTRVHIIEKAQHREYYRLSSAQKRLYFLYEFDKMSLAYNNPIIVQLEGILEKERVSNAFKNLINRHESLRTSFGTINEEIVQKISEQVNFKIESHSGEEVESIIKEFIRPFDLSQSPLIRVGLIRISDQNHLLMFDMHHIISDGTSGGILTRDFMALYNGESLPELRLQYKDYSEWQYIDKQQVAITEQKNFWLNEFLEKTTTLALPTDFARPLMKNYAGNKVGFILGVEETSKLRSLADSEGATMFMMTLSIYNILLSKLSTQEDIVIGIPEAGRHYTELENIIGLFVNTLPLRNYPKNNLSFKDFLLDVKSKALACFDNQDYQYEELIDALKVERDTSRNPLFDVMFVFQNFQSEAFEISGLMLKPYDIGHPVSKFDLTLEVFERNDKIYLNFEYSTKLFRKETIERFIVYFKNIVSVIISDVNTKISDIEIIAEEEKQKILYDFNDTAATYPKDKTIHALFEEQVKKTPDHIAVTFERERLTYRELNKKSNQLARLLRSKGVQPESIVGIIVERSLEMIVGILGILKAGGAYLPIDPAYPRERVDFMLQDSGAKIILTQKQLKSKIDPHNTIEIIEIDDNELYHGNGINLKKINHPKDLAYVIYTSGTTGNPKGVMIEYQSLVNYIWWAVKTYINNEKVCLPLYTSISFDLTVTTIFSPLISGNTILIYKEDNKLLSIEKIFTENRVNLLKLTPSHLKIIKDNDLIFNQINFDRRKKLIVGGEDLSVELAQDIQAKFNNTIDIYNEYGPTEATVGCMIYKFTIDKDNNKSVPIGIPIDNVHIYLFNKYLKPVSTGIEGELYISGDCLARGYLKREELTAEKFIGNPFEPGTKMYRTGDLARWLPDGNIEFLGRIDDQVKIRGFRIELGEIEGQLSKYEDIKEVIVTTREDKEGNKYLCAYLVTDREMSITELRDYLSKTLPDYMIPSYFVQLEELPLTPNGKIDRKALPAPEGQIASGTEYEAPRDETEEKLAQVWQQVLGIEKIGINDNFFALGGHSLRAMNIISLIHKTLSVELPLREIFTKQTIKELSESIRSQSTSLYKGIAKTEEKSYYSLSSAQKRMYILHQLDKKSLAYNMPSVIELEGNLEYKKLENAFRRLIERHEALRTSFTQNNEEPVQVIIRESCFYIEYIKPGEEVKDIISDFIRPFDLTKAPLFRVGLISIEANKHLLITDLHHIIADGTSIGIFIREFLFLYNGEELPHLKLQYKDFAEWQNSTWYKKQIKKQEKYWMKMLSGEIPRLNILTDHIRPEVFSFEGNRYNLFLQANDVKELRKLGKENGTTLFINLLTALNILMHKYTGQDDIIIGCGIAGRVHSDLLNMAGMFVNSLAIRNQLDSEITFEEFLEKVKYKSIEAFENQNYQFEELVEKLNPVRDMARNPIFDVALVVQNFEMSGSEIEGLKAKPYHYENQTTKYDLTFFVREEDNNITIQIEYYQRIFEQESIIRMSKHFINVIQQVCKNPKIKISDIEIITEEEKQKILYEFNDTSTAYPKDKIIHALFEEQADKTPGNVAIVFEEQQLNYQDLDKKANQLANYLYKRQKVQPDERVGLLFDRNIECIVGIMGILKSGGAYVPIDPDLPEERIKTMIDDAGISVLISQKIYIKLLNRLSWECDSITTYLCLDSQDIYSEEEETGGLMNQKLWDYVGETATDDISGGGWQSSYTGEYFTREEMDEYGDNILKKLSPYLNKHVKVLEIGCSSGISMYRIAPRVRLYHGIDLSKTIIEKNKQWIKEEGHSNVKLSCLPAHLIDQLGENNFDIVIINSVIQAFPGHNYLRKVINKAIGLMKSKGLLFIGDVMDQELKKELIESLRRFKEENRNSHYKTKTDFSEELFISKKYFEDINQELKEIKKVEFSNKIYSIENELTKYRYDALIKIDKNETKKTKNIQKYKYQEDNSILKKYPESRLNTGVKSDNLAYVIYTSGTTGQPKGVMIEHKGFINLIYYHSYIFSEHNIGRMSQASSISFDAMALEIFPCLLNGATLYIINNSIRLDSKKVRDWIIKNEIDLSFQTTVIAEDLLNMEWPKEGLHLKALMTGGDRLKRYPQADTPFELYNLYGPTEDTVWTTVINLDNKKQDQKYPPIGAPISNHKIYIINHNNQLQPIGIAGELCISGNGLSRGYLKRPELTAEKFIDNPFQPGEKLYKTGDLGRWLPDGNIEFLSRIDHQVKIRGFRIELGEIESQLSKHEDIKASVVIAREDKERSKYLCAYIIVRKELTITELRGYLSKTLPDYMIPSYFVQLEKLLLTPNGKIDRKALPAPEGQITSGTEYEAPRDETEEKLVKVWQEVLGIEKIGINDNFFELGGHSLRAIKVMSRLHEIGYQIELINILQYPTIKMLVQKIKKLDNLSYQGIVQGEIGLLPQQVHWVQNRYNQINKFNISVILFRSQGFDEKLIRSTFEKIVEHHDALRIIFKKDDGRVVQYNRGMEGELFDLGIITVNELKRLQKIVYSETIAMQNSIDIEKGPLLKLRLFKTIKGDHLAVCVPHIISDAISLTIMLEDFSTGYEQLLNNKNICFIEKTDSLKDWASYIYDFVKNKKFLDEIDYWNEILQSDKDYLPRDYEKKDDFHIDNSIFSISISENYTRKLIDQSKDKYSIEQVLLTAIGKTVTEWTGEKKILIDIVSHGRDNIVSKLNMSRTFGWFSISYPVLIDVLGSDDIIDQLKNTKETLTKVPNNGIGFRIIQVFNEELFIHTLREKQIIQFNYIGQIESGNKKKLFEMSSLAMGSVGETDVKRYQVFHIIAVIVDNKLIININYNNKEYKKETIEKLMEKVNQYVIKIITNIDKTHGQQGNYSK